MNIGMIYGLVLGVAACGSGAGGRVECCANSFDNLALADRRRHRLAMRSWLALSIEDTYLI